MSTKQRFHEPFKLRKELPRLPGYLVVYNVPVELDQQ